MLVFPIIFPGFPKTIEFGGMVDFMTEKAPITFP